MEQDIITYIREDIHGGRADLDIAPDDDLLTSGTLGSMDVMRLIEHLETTYAVKIEPAEMIIDHFMTARAMADLLRTKNVGA